MFKLSAMKITVDRYFLLASCARLLLNAVVILFITNYLCTPLLSQNLNLQLNEEQLALPDSVVISKLNEAIKETRFGNYEKARSIFSEIEGSSFFEQNKKDYIEMLEWRALMNKVENHYDQALADYLAILSFYEDENNQEGLAKIHTDLGEFYRARNQEDKTFYHLETAKNYFSEADIGICIKAYWFSRMAAYHTQFKGGGYNTKYYSNKGLELTGSECTLYAKALIMNELGFIYMHEQLENEALVTDYYQQSIDIYQRLNRQRDVVTVQNNLTNYYFRKLDLDKALEIINQSIKISETYNWYSALEDSYFIKMAILDYQGNYKEMARTGIKAYDSKIALMEYQYALEVAEIESQYENELEEQALKEALEDNESKQKALTYSIIIGILFLFIGVTGLILNIKFRRKNKSLNAQQEIIQNTNDQLSKTLKEKDVLFKELNHRVKNNLMVLSGLIYMQENTLKEQSQKDLYETLRYRIQAMAVVHEKLYAMDDATDINFQEYLGELIPALHQSLISSEMDFAYQTECESLKLNIDDSIPLALIFNELITNSLKHGFYTNKKNCIRIESQQNEHYHRITYQDSGPGLPDDLSIDKGDSMGLKIIHLMCAQLKADLNYGNHANGAEFIIQIPI